MLSVPDILDAVRADFELRSIDAEVEFGEWKHAYLTGGARVVVGLGDFVDEAPGEVGAPGVRDINASTGARPLFSRIQTLHVRVHGRPPSERDPKRSETAQRTTAALLHQVQRAFYAACYGSLVAGRGTWPRPQESGQDFLYGSIVDWLPGIMIPVDDDELTSVELDAELSPTQVISIDAQGGEEVVAETPAP